MPNPARSFDGPTSLLATRRALLMLSTLVRLGLLAVGLGLVLDRTSSLISDVQLTWGERVVLGIAVLAYGGGFALAGWVADRMLRAAAELISLLVDHAESASRTAQLLEHQVAPGIARVALAVERLAQGTQMTSGNSKPDDGRAIAVAGVRQAIDEGRWDRAERLLKSLRRDFPDAPEADEMAEEVTQRRRETIESLKAKIDAARAVNDPEQVITYRDELTLHLRGEALREIDQQIVVWLTALIQKRLRAGTVRPDVVELADRVSSSFGDTPQGASLRAALPTLRRSAGLCPRCANPYSGLEDACPECLSRTARPETGLERRGRADGEEIA